MAKTKRVTRKASKPAKKSAKKSASKKSASKSSAKTPKSAVKKATKAAPKKGAPKKAPKAANKQAVNTVPKAAPRKVEPPTDIAARMGRRSAEQMMLEGENPSPDEVVLQEWAYDWFLNAGGFDAIKGSNDDDPAEQAAIKQSFFDSFKTAIRTRLNIAQPNALG